jgi:outer membrane receptor protein involved in Fe transport
VKLLWAVLLACTTAATVAFAQTGTLSGGVRDETGGALPGVLVELRADNAPVQSTTTDAAGAYAFTNVQTGRVHLAFSLLNFGSATRDIAMAEGGFEHADVVMHLSLTADVVVTGKRTFTNLADAANPAENLLGIAQSASQGAITEQQLEQRPIMRTGEVLETVPGLIVTQHSGEGKANQYFLRGFNLDHGTDFASTVAGMPANMPTHAHGQGYSDLNFMIPELVTGLQFSKGPYFADQGDFATAGSSNINYATSLDQPIVHLEAGGEGFERVLAAASPRAGDGHLLAAFEASRNNGPWVRPDDYQKLNGVLRYSQGDNINGFSITAMAYHGTWNSTDQIPERALEEGLITRFGGVDPTDGGHTYRYSLSGDWQHGSENALTRVTAYGIGYDLGLYSNFTFFLNDPTHSDQIEQADHRFVSGLKASHTRMSHWAGHLVQNTFGIQVRNDDIGNVGLYHTQARVRLSTTSQDAVIETTGGIYGQSQIEWTPWLRTTAGLRADASRFRVNALDAINSGTASAGLVSPKGGIAIGPWKATEFYINGGMGFHSNDARGTTIMRDADGNPADRVTPLVRAKGAEAGVRTVALRHLQSTLSVWTLRLDSELVFAGDAGTTEASRPSERRGIEWTNYYSPFAGAVFDADVSWSRARFTEFDPVGQYVPEALNRVVSAGATVEDFHGTFGSLRWRYFGPRALVEDDSVRSKATSLVNLQAGYRLSKTTKIAVDVFNLFNAADSDIDYYYASRLPGEPLAGIEDVHTHPAPPRTARINLIVGF